MCSSCSFTTDSFQKYPWRSCTHSKYEVVTPPALHKISGITNTRLSARISSAAAVVGPFAPSARILHLDRKSTRLNSSHTVISYAVFCLKKKKKKQNIIMNKHHK